VMEASPEHLLVAHMGMSGRFYRVPIGEPEEKHLHLAIELENGEEIRYVDPRRFGGIRLIKNEAELFAHLGPEPWDDVLESHFRVTLGRRGCPVKAALLDQSVVAGIGNIYADEILYAARIAPDRPARYLSDVEVSRLVAETRRVLEAGIAMRGTTFRDYRDGIGRRGDFADHLSVYGRKGELCPRCRVPLHCIRIAGRSTHFCRVCQH
jgi:formamidopyrimidine-DNA glycosylase